MLSFGINPHLQNLTYRPTLQLSLKGDQYHLTLLKSIETSGDAVRILYQLNERAPLIHFYPMVFQQLLLRIFGNLLLAVSKGPDICRNTRDEFDIFL